MLLENATLCRLSNIISIKKFLLRNYCVGEQNCCMFHLGFFFLSSTHISSMFYSLFPNHLFPSGHEICMLFWSQDTRLILASAQAATKRDVWKGNVLTCAIGCNNILVFLIQTEHNLEHSCKICVYIDIYILLCNKLK